MKIHVNTNYKNLTESYLFSEVKRRVQAYQAENPGKRVISLGIGDVTLPLPKAVIRAMAKANEEMGHAETFRGYAPEYGYDFLRDAIAGHYAMAGVTLDRKEIFVGDGAKTDLGNLVDILGDNEILIPDPVYPVYVDSNLMAGRRIRLLPAGEENGFLPMPDDSLTGEGYVIYICSPNNPTGAVYSREQLAQWCAFANRTGSLIIFDSAYEAFIGVTGDTNVSALPHSIYEVKGARTCAIEVCSFSKTAGFTGVRAGWTVIPEELEAEGLSLAKMWARRQATKYNGLSYIVQRGAEAAFTKEGYAECLENLSYYMGNAKLLADVMREKGMFFTGGVSSPYLWLRCPDGMKSWEFFDFLLQRVQLVGTPGAGFGSCGEGYFRLTSFGKREDTVEAAERLRKIL